MRKQIVKKLLGISLLVLLGVTLTAESISALPVNALPPKEGVASYVDCYPYCEQWGTKLVCDEWKSIRVRERHPDKDGYWWKYSNREIYCGHWSTVRVCKSWTKKCD